MKWSNYIVFLASLKIKIFFLLVNKICFEILNIFLRCREKLLENIGIIGIKHAIIVYDFHEIDLSTVFYTNPYIRRTNGFKKNYVFRVRHKTLKYSIFNIAWFSIHRNGLSMTDSPTLHFTVRKAKRI